MTTSTGRPSAEMPRGAWSPNQQRTCHRELDLRDLPRDRCLAPAWHTALLVGLFLMVAVVALVSGWNGGGEAQRNAAQVRLVSRYLPTIAVEMALAAYVVRVGRPRCALGALLGRRWQSWRRAAIDVGIALACALAIMVAELAWAPARSPSDAVSAILPRTMLERCAWVLVALSVGVSEELVYRGYLQRQFAAFTRSPAGAIALSAALFGLAHGEQGLAAALRIALYGAGLGVVAMWRRSLLPGILCHVGIDLVSGLLPRA